MKALLKIAALAAGAAGVYVAARAGEEIRRIASGKTPLPEDFTYTAHSGCENTPDNSMESIEKAMALGVPVLEVDVSVRNDGTPVLLHAESAADDEGLLLEDALRYIAEKSDTVQVNLDLKAFSNLPEITALIQKYNMQTRCFFTGVDSAHTQTVKIDAPGIPYYLNAELNRMRAEDEDYLLGLAREVQRSGAIGLNCHYKNARPKLMKLFHREGLKVSLWTVDNKLAMRMSLAMAPDNITTRCPILLSSLLADRA